jgi:hypothetical protein
VDGTIIQQTNLESKMSAPKPAEPLNKLQIVFARLTDAELLQAVLEIHHLDVSGILRPGVVLKLASTIHNETGISAHDGLTLAQTHVIRMAAFKWAGV